jgi:hypothetical protein
MSEIEPPDGDGDAADGKAGASGADDEWLDPLLALRNLEHRSASDLGIELDAPVHRRRRWVFAVVVLVAAGLVAYLVVGRSDAKPTLTDLAGGDCYSPAVDRPTDEVSPRSCDEPHAAELVNFYRDPAGSADPYPGQAELIVYAQSACVQRAIELAGVPVDALVKRGVVLKASVPDEAEWGKGQRAMACSVVDVHGRDLDERVLTHR